MTALITLCQNAALLVIGVQAYGLVRPWLDRRSAALATLGTGASFALLMLLGLLAPLDAFPDFILDERAPLAALATVFGGPLTGVIAAMPAAIFRIWLGGPGVPGALFSLTVSVLLAWTLRRWAAHRGVPIRARHLTVLGAAISLLVLPAILVIHGPAVLAKLAGPVTLSVILGVVGFGTLINLGDRRHQLRQEIARRDRVLQRSQEAVTRILQDQLLSACNLDAQLRAITRIGAEALDIDAVSVWRYEGDGRTSHCLERWDAAAAAYRRGPDGHLDPARNIRTVLGEHLVYRAADARIDPIASRYFARVYPNAGPTSVLFTAIRQAGRLVGHLSFASVGHHRNWTIEEEALARSLADLASLALLKDELDRRERVLRRNQDLLVDIVRHHLLSADPIETVLRSITQTVGTTLGIDRVAIWKLDEAAREFRCVDRWEGARQEHVPIGVIPCVGPLFDELERNTIAVIDDYAADPRVEPAFHAFLGVSAPKSLLVALVRAPDRAIGLLALGAVERKRAWTIEDQALARSLADLIAFTLLSQSYRQAIAALDLVRDGILVQRPSSEIVYANRAARELGTDIDQLMPISEPGEDGGETREISRIAADGTRRELSISRARLPGGGAITMLSDITAHKADQRRQLLIEDRLQQSMKMEAIGRLAGGVAHDFNNMIGAILGFATFLVEDLPAHSTQQAFATRITQVCTRARAVVTQLLTFARSGDAVKRTLDLSTVVSDNITLIEAGLPGTVQFSVELGAAPLPVLANQGLLSQLLLNLCVSAKDALDERGGRIDVSLERVEREHPDRRLFDDGSRDPDTALVVGGRLDPARRYGAIKVTDNGVGMRQTTLDRIFEPFSSRRGGNYASDLGLAVVHGIVTAHDGAYAVRSHPSCGSTFSIYLPLAEPADGACPA